MQRIERWLRKAAPQPVVVPLRTGFGPNDFADPTAWHILCGCGLGRRDRCGKLRYPGAGKTLLEIIRCAEVNKRPHSPLFPRNQKPILEGKRIRRRPIDRLREIFECVATLAKCRVLGAVGQKYRHKVHRGALALGNVRHHLLKLFAFQLENAEPDYGDISAAERVTAETCWRRKCRVRKGDCWPPRQ